MDLKKRWHENKEKIAATALAERTRSIETGPFYKVVQAQQPRWVEPRFFPGIHLLDYPEVFPGICGSHLAVWRKNGILRYPYRQKMRFADVLLVYLMSRTWWRDKGRRIVIKRHKERVRQMLRLMMKSLLLHPDLGPNEWAEMEFVFFKPHHYSYREVLVSLGRHCATVDEVSLKVPLRPLFDWVKQMELWDRLVRSPFEDPTNVRKTRARIRRRRGPRP